MGNRRKEWKKKQINKEKSEHGGTERMNERRVTTESKKKKVKKKDIMGEKEMKKDETEINTQHKIHNRKKDRE